MLGFLSQEDLTAELLRTKVLAAPSIGMESFGMVLTRAFACAVPVVSSDIDGYRDVMTAETGLLVPPGRPCGAGRGDRHPARGRAAAAAAGRSGTHGRRRALRLGLDRRAPRRGVRGRHRARRPERGDGVMRLLRDAAPESAGCGSGRSWPRSRALRRAVYFGGPDWSQVGGRVPGGRVGVAGGRDRSQSRLCRGPGFRVGDRDRRGGAAAASAVPPRLLSVLRGAARERHHAGTRRRARPGGGADAAYARAARRVGDAGGDGVRAPRVRCHTGCSARRLGAACGGPPTLGRAEPRHPLLHRRVAARDRIRAGATPRPHPPRQRACRSPARGRWSAMGSASCTGRPPAAAAIVFQLIGWLCQLFAVWLTMKAFSIDVGFAAAGLVLVLMNMAAIVPLWPGNVGPAPGRDRRAARRLRRPVRAGLRVRPRPADHRGVRGHRLRARVPRTGRALVRGSPAHAACGRGARGGRGARKRRKRRKPRWEPERALTL